MRLRLFLVAACFIPLISAQTPPSEWRAINYGPRQHQYFRMLYDWYYPDNDVVGYQLVSASVSQDLARLAQNGFNVLHLYLWDRELLVSACAGEPGCQGEPSGFLSGTQLGGTNYVRYSQGKVPSVFGDGSQWTALSEFIGQAEANGLWVILHFASGRARDLADAGQGFAAGNHLVDWAKIFIDYLVQERNHRRILAWGIQYSLWPDANSLIAQRSIAWQRGYTGIENVLAAHRAAGRVLPGTGLVATNMPIDTEPPLFLRTKWIIPRGSGYLSDVATSQKIARTMYLLLGNRDPDIYMMQLYHPHSVDLRQSLAGLWQYTTDPSRRPIDRTRVFVSEFTTSTSINNSLGYVIASYGDVNTATSDHDGQVTWLRNALCAYRSEGINKYAWWAMYDPLNLWVSWNMPPSKLAWNAFWGVANEFRQHGDKPSFLALRDLYLSNFPACSSYLAKPIVKVVPSTNIYTVNQPVKVSWAASDFNSLRFNTPRALTVVDCAQPAVVVQNAAQFDDPVEGSCGTVNLYHFSTPMTFTVKLKAQNSYYNDSLGNSIEGQGAFIIASNSQVNYFFNSRDYTSTIRQSDRLNIIGAGFTVSGGNGVWLYNPTTHFSDWVDATDGPEYQWQDLSHNAISFNLNNRYTPGTWQIYVWNGYVWSNQAFLNIVP